MTRVYGRRFYPRVEGLEHRELPSTSSWLSETFDSTTVGSLPAGWSQWSSAGGTAGASAQIALRSVNSLRFAAPSIGAAARAWLNPLLPADVQLSAALHFDSQTAGQLFVRGRNLTSTAPSYYAVSLTAGQQVQFLRVVNGAATVLGHVRATGAANEWLRLTLYANGSNLRVQVFRTATGQYLAGNGQWQAPPTWAISLSDRGLPGLGKVGLARTAGTAGTTYFDDAAIDLPNASQQFDSTPTGRLPGGWSSWTSDGGVTGSFHVESGRSLSGAHGLASGTGASSIAARAWSTTVQPADVQAGASFFVDSLIPAGVLVRGMQLDSATPSYYSLLVTRGLSAELVLVSSGKRTVLGQVRSAGYFDNQWVRVTLSAGGGNLRAQIYRLDDGRYLNSVGQWQVGPTYALNVSDATLAGPGLAGVERPARYAGTVALDDFAAYPLVADQEPPSVAIRLPAAGSALSGVVAVEATATDNISVTRVEFYVDGVLQAADTSSPYRWEFDTTTASNATHTLGVRAYDASGNTAWASVNITTQNDTSLSRPEFPRHYRHIRIAELAYTGTPFGAFEDGLLRSSVDLVIPAAAALGHINNVAPSTPQLLYANVSNLYQESLLDWLAYADKNSLSRAGAFYHAARALPFAGNSPSSVPVSWFWSVYRGDAALSKYTSQARGIVPGGVPFGAAGQAVYVGYPERFREINVQLATAAANGWSAVLEYPTAVDAAGRPTAWGTLAPLSDGSAGLTHSGQLTFDPPTDWQPASIGSAARLYYVRFRTGSGGTAPVARTILGRDYVGAHGTTSGMIPAFDATADANHDGYLNDAEYAHRTPGMDARFRYESRLFYGNYGQMRFAVNPSNLGIRNWATDYSGRLLQSQPLAAGLFVDNSGGNTPVSVTDVMEPVASYANDYGSMLNAVARHSGPHWLLLNTAGGGSSADPVIQRVQGYFDEFALRPLANNWQQFQDIAGTVAHRATLRAPAPYTVLDSLPTGGSPTDPRTQVATLAYYYLLGDPNSTFLDFFGGFGPGTSWRNHWSAAAAYDVGQPAGSWSLFASGADPSNTALSYRIYQRSYGNALVLYKPLSYGRGASGTLAAATATTHALPGTYRSLNADGTLGATVTSISLRNGEGAILVKV